jgi:transcriptional regulator with XRE-family HTH domain
VDLHRRIRTLRLRRGLTGMELARRSGVSPSYVSLIEHGEKIPSEEVAVRIARVLGEREDIYRVWAATARMDEATRQAVWRLRGADPDLQRISRGGEELDGEVIAEAGFDAPGGPGEFVFPEGHRPPGRPRVAERYEFQVAYKLEDDERAPTLRIPLLVPGSAPDTDPPPQDEVEALVALDARILDRSSAHGLIALRVDDTNGRDVASWLRPRDLVVIERNPHAFDPALVHAFRLPEGLRLCRAGLVPGHLLLLPDPAQAGAPRAIPLDGEQTLEKMLYGTVLWSARLWPLA